VATDCNSDPTAPESCENCQHDIPAIPQEVFIPLERTVTIDVSLDKSNVPRTQLIVPSGAFARDAIMSIFEVPQSTVGVGSGSGRQESDFSSRVLSTPFRCSSNVAGNFALNITVSAAIDRLLFDVDAVLEAEGVPCEFLGAWTNEISIFRNIICPHNYFFTSTGFTLNSCGKQDLVQEFVLTSVDTEIAQAADLVAAGQDATGFSPLEPVIFDQLAANPTSTRCMCFDIRSTTSSTDPETLELAGITSACITMRRVGNTMELWQSRTAGLVDKCLPPSADENDPLFRFTRITLNQFGNIDACAALGSIQEIPPSDICLGRFIGGRWDCLQGFFERSEFPTYSPSVGGPRNRVVGRIPNCGFTYAFVNVELGAAPLVIIIPPSFWDLYGNTIIGLSIFFFIFGIGAGYTIYRLNRYRTKYREEKKEQDRLAYRVNELDEFAGGLGVADADDEVTMMPNPLVLEMQQLEQRQRVLLEQAKDTAEEDAAHIEQLQSERQAVYAEIQRLKAEIDKQNAVAPTRNVDTTDTATFATTQNVVSPVSTNADEPKQTFGANKAASKKGKRNFGGAQAVRKPKQID
jgi:hypothetical protein